MYIYFDMLGPLIMDRVGREIDDEDIVTINKCSHCRGSMDTAIDGAMKFLRYGISHGAIFDFNVEMGGGSLALRRPRDQILTEKHTISRGGASSVGATTPVSL